MTAPSRFRKKPVVVEAVLFDGTEDNLADLRAFTNNQFHLVDEEDRDDDPDNIAAVFDYLHSTWVGVKIGQSIIKGVVGEFYPIDPEVLAATHDALDS